MPAYRIAKHWDQIAYFLYQMDPQPDKWIFCENNSPDDTVYRLARFKRPHELIRFWVRRNVACYSDTMFDIIAIARQFLLQRARQLDPDWAVLIDSDIEVLTPNILDRLTSHDCVEVANDPHTRRCDIVGAPYLRWSPVGTYLSCAWQLPYGPRINPEAMFLKEPMRLWDTWMAAVSGGCMALSRRILQDRRLNFYPVERPELDVKAGEDFSYCLDARRLRYVIGLDSSVKLGHLNRMTLWGDSPWQVDENLKLPIFEYPETSESKVGEGD